MSQNLAIICIIEIITGNSNPFLARITMQEWRIFICYINQVASTLVGNHICKEFKEWDEMCNTSTHHILGRYRDIC